VDSSNSCSVESILNYEFQTYFFLFYRFLCFFLVFHVFLLAGIPGSMEGPGHSIPMCAKNLDEYPEFGWQKMTSSSFL